MEVKTNTAVETTATEITETKAETANAEVVKKSLVDEYFAAKNEGKLLLYQVDDFYEVMGEEAKAVAEKFHLTLTTRKNDTNGESVPMVGFPEYLLKGYEMALREEGYEVEIRKKPEEAKNKKTDEIIKVASPKIKPEEVPDIDYNRFLPIFNFDNMSDEEICLAACNKLVQDTYFGINGLPLIACWLHMYNKAKKDTDFAKKVTIRSKDFTKAFDYLFKEVRSMAHGGGGIGLDHRQIFAILEDYFGLDDKEIAEKEAKRKAEEEAKRKAREAEAKAKKSKKASKAKSKATDAKADEEKAEEAAKKEAEKAAAAQGNLFDLLGGCM